MKQEMHVLGIDIAKRVFHAVGMDDRDNVVYRTRLSRHDLMPFIATLPPVLIGMEACGGAHDWARRFREHGHEVKLMAPQFVKPYIKSNKNDMRDAEGIGEAVTRPTMRFVPTKEVDQQDIQALHRVRERLIGARTALVNEIHGLLHEYGIVVPKGVEFIPIKPLVATGSSAPGSCAGHSRVPSPDHGLLASTGESGLSRCDSASHYY